MARAFSGLAFALGKASLQTAVAPDEKEWGLGSNTSMVGLLAAALALGGTAPGRSGKVVPRASAPEDMATKVLKVHNRYRASVGAKPLQWNPQLAVAAGSYGPALAAIGKLVHSARDGRRGQSENLWMGTSGKYTIEAMIEYWADERRMMRAGVFPNVSTTRDWLDVSHYTQMIWPDTTHVGCHLQRARIYDILICRYSPKGNQDGRVVGR